MIRTLFTYIPARRTAALEATALSDIGKMPYRSLRNEDSKNVLRITRAKRAGPAPPRGESLERRKGMKAGLSKSAMLSSLLGVAALALATSADARDLPWQRDHQNYEFKHPMKTTCSEFIGVEDVYRNYVVAYLTGNSHGKNSVEVVDEGFEISVPEVVETCTTQPDKSVWEVVDTMVKGHN